MQTFSRAVVFWGFYWATQTFNTIHRFPIGMRIRDWPDHGRTLNVCFFCFFLCNHHFVAKVTCLGCCHAIRSSHVLYSMLLPMEGGFMLKSHHTLRHSSFAYCKSVVLFPVQKSCPKNMMFPLPCFHVGIVWFWDVTLSSYPSNKASGVYIKEFYFCLIWSHDILTFNWSW